MDAAEMASETIRSEVHNLYGTMGNVALASTFLNIYSMNIPAEHQAIISQGAMAVATGVMTMDELRGHYAVSAKLEQCFGGDPILRTRLALVGAEMWLAMYEGRHPDTVTIPEPALVWTPW